MGLRTPLYEKHLEANGKMVDFGGWDMPLHYGSQIEEHHKVRKDAGMFDVSHMVITDIKGEHVRDLFRLLLANDVDKLRQKGRALYSCMLNSQGTVLDDVILYYMEDNWFRLISNAATRAKDLDWVSKAANEWGEIGVTERSDLAMIAVQGPHAKEKVYAALGEGLREAAQDLKPFNAATVGELFVATTGYTGEEGFEIILPAKAAPFTWQMLLDAGVSPCGLGARDTLRLEAGMALYGQDMSEDTNPLEVGLAWTVAWEPKERSFVGRDSLEKVRAEGSPSRMVGLLLLDKGILRRHQTVECNGLGNGEITSGGFSPTLNKSIALAQVPSGVSYGDICKVHMRGKIFNAQVVKYPFVRNGKSCLD